MCWVGALASAPADGNSAGVHPGQQGLEPRMASGTGAATQEEKAIRSAVAGEGERSQVGCVAAASPETPHPLAQTSPGPGREQRSLGFSRGLPGVPRGALGIQPLREVKVPF